MGTTYRGITTTDRLVRCKKYANSRNGECLSAEYKNTNTRLKWRCSLNHEWFAAPTNVLYKGKWCPFCARNAKLTLKHAISIAKKRGGQCLSEGPIKASKKLLWKCQFGHEWEATYNNVQRGSWCPYCICFFGETVVRLYFEKYFGVKFSKVKLPCLDGLELDGYSKELSVAFEYNGPQHYTNYSGFLHSENIQKRDRKKARLCRKNNITLITIKYVKKNDVNLFIRKIERALMLNNFERKHINIDFSEIYPYKISECIRMAADHEGKCLSTAYLGYDKKLLWECKYGHQWKTTMYLVQKGHWCPKCGRKRNRV